MTFGSEQPATRAADVVSEPDTVGVGHHPICANLSF
jgi:hypothetical protein